LEVESGWQTLLQAAQDFTTHVCEGSALRAALRQNAQGDAASDQHVGIDAAPFVELRHDAVISAAMIWDISAQPGPPGGGLSEASDAAIENRSPSGASP
jgi:hypothetical protein